MFFWNVQCSNCGLWLRLKVPEEKVGKEVDAICTKCKTKTRTTIGLSIDLSNTHEIECEGESLKSGNFDNLPQEIKDSAHVIIERIKNDPEIASHLKKIVDTGFLVSIDFNLIGFNSAARGQRQNVDECGNIVLGTFSKEDEEELRRLKIKL